MSVASVDDDGFEDCGVSFPVVDDGCENQLSVGFDGKVVEDEGRFENHVLLDRLATGGFLPNLCLQGQEQEEGKYEGEKLLHGW